MKEIVLKIAVASSNVTVAVSSICFHELMLFNLNCNSPVLCVIYEVSSLTQTSCGIIIYTLAGFQFLRIVLLHEKHLNPSDGKECERRKLKFISTLK